MIATGQSSEPIKPAGLVVRAWAMLGMPARPELLGMLRQRLRCWGVSSRLDADVLDAVVLCVDEAVSNAVEHAYRDSTGTIDVHATRTDDPSTLTVTVTDRGRWRLPSPNPGNRGRGLAIVRMLAHEFDVVTGATGTTVTMAWTHVAAA